jgi:hypothetical protein
MKAKKLQTKYKNDNHFILLHSNGIIEAVFSCPIGCDLYPKIEQYFQSTLDYEIETFGESYMQSFDIRLNDIIDNDVWIVRFKVIYHCKNDEIIKENYELRRHEGGVL